MDAVFGISNIFPEASQHNAAKSSNSLPASQPTKPEAI
jgi:hypothetical protein